MRKEKYRAEEKITVVKEYLEGKTTGDEVAKRLGANKQTVYAWISNYRSMGEEAFQDTGHNRNYPKWLKESADKDYLSGEGSYQAISEKYGIKSTRQLRVWVKMYNSYDELKSSGAGGNIMTKGRKTTFDERVEIVEYCLAHDRNYAQTAEKYGVSYQQARSYTVKYENGGVEALQDRRGKRKPEESLTEVERLRAENKLLRAEKERIQMEVDFLKNSTN